MRATGNKLARIKTALTTFPLEYKIQVQYTQNNQTIILDEDNINMVDYYFDGDILKSNMQVLILDSIEDIEKDTIIEFSMKIKTSNGYETLNYGNFKVVEKEKKEDDNSYLITCYDKLIDTMVPYETPTNVTYPITLGNYLDAICNHLGLTLATTTFTNSTIEIPSEKYLGLGYTFRNVLDEISQATGTSICINRSTNYVELRTPNTTNDTINEDYVNQQNVTIGEKFGPINSIVLSRAAESDNVYIKDDESIALNGLCEIKIVDNQLMNDNNRSDYLQGISSNLFGLTYYQNDYTTSNQGVLYYDFLDKYNMSLNNSNYSCLMLNDNQIIDKDIDENIYTRIPKTSETDYSKASETDKKINMAYIMVDKMQQEIEAKVSQDEIIAKLNLAIEDGQGIVYFKGNLFVVDADNLKIDKLGNVSAYNLNVLGGSIVLMDDGTQQNSSIKIKTPSQYVENLAVGQNLNGKKLQMNLQNYSYSTLQEIDNYSLITTSINGESKSLILHVDEDEDETQYLHFYVYEASQFILREIKNLKFENGVIPNNFELDLTEYYEQFGTITSLTSNSIKNDIKVITYEVERETAINGSGIIADIKSDYDFVEADVTRAQQIIAGQIQPTEYDYQRLDVNKDGIINTLDLLKIQKYVMSGIGVDNPGKFIINTQDIEKNMQLLDGNGNEIYSLNLVGGMKLNSTLHVGNSSTPQDIMLNGVSLADFIGKTAIRTIGLNSNTNYTIGSTYGHTLVKLDLDLMNLNATNKLSYSSNNGYIVIGSGVNHVKVNANIMFRGIAGTIYGEVQHNSTTKQSGYATTPTTGGWAVISLTTRIFAVNQGDIIKITIGSGSTGTIQVGGGAGQFTYLNVEVID